MPRVEGKRELQFVASITAIFLLCAVGAQFVLILLKCDGHFIYPLDDPYIDLQFAAEIARGHYGLMDTAISSPASSVLYPLMLAAIRPLRLGLYAPLIINVCAAILTMIGLASLLRRRSDSSNGLSLAPNIILLFLLCITIDEIDLAFIGLEHSIHQLVSILIVIETARAIDNYAADCRRSPGWLIPLCATAPLWRFEALDLVLCSGIALAVAGDRRTASRIAGATATTLAAYFGVMYGAGLPLLPSSVLAKWLLTNGNGNSPILKICLAFLKCLGQIETWPLLIIAAALVVTVMLAPPDAFRRRNRLLVAIYCGVVAGHMAFGAWSWLGRYSPYMLGVGAATSLLVWEPQVSRFLATIRPISVCVAGVVLMTISLVPSQFLLESITGSSRNIYEQQYQIRRFVVNYYQAPVAANDIGLLSWNNRFPVLDLWGVSDEEARHARIDGRSDRIAHLVEERQVGLVMVYDDWFQDQIPDGWRKLATLSRSGVSMTGFKSVSFYATSLDAVTRVVSSLKAFQSSLPPGAILAVALPPGSDTPPLR